MATIVGNSKYGEGHRIILKETTKLPIQTKNAFIKEHYNPGKSVFTITTNKNNIKKVSKTITLSEGDEYIFLKDERSKIVLVVGKTNTINGAFNHDTPNSKSLTNVLTEIKEKISMWIFESLIEDNVILSEDDIISRLGSNSKYYSTIFYESSLKQVQVLKKQITGKGYTYERQKDNLTKNLYDKARKLSRKTNDNWNPGDVWMIKRGFDMDRLSSINDLNVLNGEIALAYNNKELIPISLKQITSAKAKFSVVDTSKQPKFDYDFSFQKIDFSGYNPTTKKSFANFIIESKCGYIVRGGFKASSISLNVSLEGRWVGSGSQVGAVDAKTYPVHIKERYGYTLRNGTRVTKAEHEIAKKELKEIYEMYGRVSHTLNSYEEAISLFTKSDDFTKNRFSNIVSYMYSFLVAPTKVKDGFEENMQFCFLSSKKLTTGASMYVLIDNG